jgi:hypothetical protein
LSSQSSDEELAEVFASLSPTTTTLRFELSVGEVKKELVEIATSTAGTSEPKSEVDVEEKTSGAPALGAVESDTEDVALEVNEEKEQEWTEISAADSSSSPSPNVSSPSTPALFTSAPPSPAADTAVVEEEYHGDPASPTITPADLASSFSASEFPSSPSSSTFPDDLPPPVFPSAGSLPFAAVPSAFSHFFSATLTQRGASLSSLLSQPDSALSRLTSIASSLPAIAGTGENPIPAFATAFSAAVKEVAEGVRLEAQEVKDEFDRLRAECDREGKRFEQDVRATLSLKKDEKKEKEEEKEEEREEETPATTEEEAAAVARSQKGRDDREKQEYDAYLIDTLKIHFPDKDGKEAPQVVAKRKALEAALKAGSVEVEGEEKEEVDSRDSDDDLSALTESDDYADLPPLTMAAGVPRPSPFSSSTVSSASPSSTLSTVPSASQHHQQARLEHLVDKEARKRDRARRRAEKEQKRVEKEMRRDEREKKRAAKEKEQKGKAVEAVEVVEAKEGDADVVAPSPPSTATMASVAETLLARRVASLALGRTPRPYASTSSSTLPSPPSSPIDSSSPILLTSFLLLCRSTLSLDIEKDDVRKRLTGIWFEGKGGRGEGGVDALVGRAAEELL